MTFQPKPSQSDNKIVKAAAIIIVALMIFLVVQMSYFNRINSVPDDKPNPDSVEPDDMAPPDNPDAPWAPDGSSTETGDVIESEEPDSDDIVPTPDPQPLQDSGQSGWFGTEDEPIVSPGPLLDVKAVITGPENGNVGDLVKFSSIGSVAKSLSWRIVPPEGEAHTIIGINGDLAFSYSKPGIYTILLIAVRDNDHDIALHTYINGGQPLPEPDVEPNVDPDGPVPIPDDIPDHWSALTLLTKQAVLEKVPNSPRRVETANKMADSMDAIASAIAAGVLTDAQSIREETRAKNIKAIGPFEAVVWMDAAIWLGNKIAEYDAKGYLTTVEDYRVAWVAIAKGLRSVSTQAE